jgi:ATP-dependent Clp protease ATP-binding subunit ClpA
VGANVLVAIFSEKQSHAVYLLTRRKSRGSTSSTSSRTACPRAPKRSGGKPRARRPKAKRRRARGPHSTSTRPTSTARPVEGKIDPLIGRRSKSSAPSRSSAGAARTIRSMSARPAWARRRSPKGLARLIVEGKVPDVLRTARSIARHGRADRRAPSTAAISRSASRVSSPS